MTTLKLATVKRQGQNLLRELLDSAHYESEYRRSVDGYHKYMTKLNVEGWSEGVKVEDPVFPEKVRADNRGLHWEEVDSNLYKLGDDSSDWFYIPDFIPEPGDFHHIAKELKWSYFKSRWHSPVQFSSNSEFNALDFRIDFLEYLQQRIQDELGILSQFAAINLYESAVKGIGPHMDGIPFQMQAIYSIGSPARFNIYRRIADLPIDKNKNLVSRILLQPNSLLIAGCFSQRQDLVHAVNNKGPRMSIQFRHFIKPKGNINLTTDSKLRQFSSFLNK